MKVTFPFFFFQVSIAFNSIAVPPEERTAKRGGKLINPARRIAKMVLMVNKNE